MQTEACALTLWIQNTYKETSQKSLKRGYQAEIVSRIYSFQYLSYNAPFPFGTWWTETGDHDFMRRESFS